MYDLFVDVLTVLKTSQPEKEVSNDVIVCHTTHKSDVTHKECQKL